MGEKVVVVVVVVAAVVVWCGGGVGVEEVVSRAEGDGCCYGRSGGWWRTSS